MTLLLAIAMLQAAPLHLEPAARRELLLRAQRVQAALEALAPRSRLPYILEVTGGIKRTRGADDCAAAPEFDRLTHLELVLRPDRAAPSSPPAAAICTGAECSELVLEWEASEAGSYRARGPAGAMLDPWLPGPAAIIVSISSGGVTYSLSANLVLR